MSIPSPSYETPQASPPPPAPPAPQGAPLHYEYKSVQALRGTVSRTKTRWQDQGWEFVSENQGTLRTELTFRRVKPKTFGVHLLSVAATFRRLPSKTQSVLVASFALIVVVGI